MFRKNKKAIYFCKKKKKIPSTNLLHYHLLPCLVCLAFTLPSQTEKKIGQQSRQASCRYSVSFILSIPNSLVSSSVLYQTTCCSLSTCSAPIPKVLSLSWGLSALMWNPSVPLHPSPAPNTYEHILLELPVTVYIRIAEEFPPRQYTVPIFF